MSSKPNDIHNEPWTPGPWAIDGGSCEHGISAVTTDSEGRHTRRSTVVMLAAYSEDEQAWYADNWRKDAALIALAPEMAEAILVCDPKWVEGWAPELRAVANKLRKLKGQVR